MTLKDFAILKKLMTLSTSDNDHEALASLRQATAILARSGHTWESCLNRTISVINEVESAPELADDDLASAFDLALRNAKGEFRGVLESIREQYNARGFISDRQRAVVMGAADRVAERHPGGRVRWELYR
jgi:hypothetical protein